MPRRRIDIAIEAIDYKNPDLLKKFVTESGKILPRRVTGMPAHLHRKNHARNQAQPLGALDEIECSGARRIVSVGAVTQRRYNSSALSASLPLRLSRSLALLDQLPKLARFAQLRVFRDREFACGKENRETCSCAGRDGR